MTDDAMAPTPCAPRRRRRVRSVTPFAALVGLVLVAAACGGGSASPGVASLGPTTTTTSPAGAQRGSNATNYADAVSYSQCMRTHGVPNMPDPNSQGNFLFQSGKVNGQSGINPGSSLYVKADRTCSHLLPNGGQMTPAEQQQALAKTLKFVQCMRTHGLPNMADPTTRNGGITLRVPAGEGPNSPKFQAAQKACQSLSPLGGP
jgi:hypothetical protein